MRYKTIIWELDGTPFNTLEDIFLATNHALRVFIFPQVRYTIIANAIRNTGCKDVRMNVCRWYYLGTWVNP